MQFTRRNKEYWKEERQKEISRLERIAATEEHDSCRAAETWHKFFAVKPVRIQDPQGNKRHFRYAMLETVYRRAVFEQSWNHQMTWEELSHWEYKDKHDVLLNELAGDNTEKTYKKVCRRK